MPAGEGGAAAIEALGALLRLWSTRPHVLPEETRRHLKAGLRENLIATRTLVDAGVRWEEARRRRRARAAGHAGGGQTARAASDPE